MAARLRSRGGCVMCIAETAPAAQWRPDRTLLIAMILCTLLSLSLGDFNIQVMFASSFSILLYMIDFIFSFRQESTNSVTPFLPTNYA